MSSSSLPSTTASASVRARVVQRVNNRQIRTPIEQARRLLKEKVYHVQDLRLQELDKGHATSIPLCQHYGKLVEALKTGLTALDGLVPDVAGINRQVNAQLATLQAEYNASQQPAPQDQRQQQQDQQSGGVPLSNSGAPEAMETEAASTGPTPLEQCQQEMSLAHEELLTAASQAFFLMGEQSRLAIPEAATLEAMPIKDAFTSLARVMAHDNGAAVVIRTVNLAQERHDEISAVLRGTTSSQEMLNLVQRFKLGLRGELVNLMVTLKTQQRSQQLMQTLTSFPAFMEAQRMANTRGLPAPEEAEEEEEWVVPD